MQERRLAAIMFTDIVGYTTMMGSDEDRAFEVLAQNREIHTKFIEQFNGTLIKEMGDGMLISFDLASDAVRCAIEIQKACKPASPAGGSHDIPLKIGIHEGEMVFEGNDVLGDGVNIASRIQENTEAGCISISGSVYRDIKNKADILTEYVGERFFKNVDEPIKVYNVYWGDMASTEIKSTKSDGKSPKKKSIIVLPFVNMSPEPDQEYFSDGLTEEVITDLSHIHELLVISRNSAMTFKGSGKTTKEIVEKVNVRYVLEGSVRKAGNNLRITAQLIDGANDAHLWAEKYSGNLQDIFDIQESVSRQIVDSLRLQLGPEEDLILANKPFENIKAYECWLKARQYIFNWTKESLDLAKQYLVTALEIIGEHPVLYAAMGFLYVQYFNCGVKKDPAIFKEAEKYVNKAFELYPEVFLGHYALGFALYLQGNVKSAIKHIKRAIEIEPTNSDAMRMLCYQYSILLGKPEKAIQLARRVIELDPLTPINYLAPALIHWAHGNFKNAKDECKKYHQMAPDNIHAQCWYSILLIWSGELEEAYSIIEKTKNDYPGETMTKLMLFLGYANRNEIDKVNSTLSEDFLIYAWNDHFYTWFLADGFSLLDKKDESIKWLKRTIDLGFINYPFIAEIDPFLINIRGEVPFHRLLKKVKSEWENFNA